MFIRYAPENELISIRYDSLKDDDPELLNWISGNFKSSRNTSVKAIRNQFGIYWDENIQDQTLNFSKTLCNKLIAYRLSCNIPKLATSRVRNSSGPYKKKSAVASTFSPKYHRYSILKMHQSKGVDDLVRSICYKNNSLDNMKAKKSVFEKVLRSVKDGVHVDLPSTTTRVRDLETCYNICQSVKLFIHDL